MPLRSDWSAQACPIARSLDSLGDPWTVLILRGLFTGTRRFDELRSTLGIADTVLSRRLTDMEAAGLLQRVNYTGVTRPRHDYHLTDAGADALPILHALALWGAKHAPPPPGTPPMVMLCTVCGSESRSADWCVACDTPLTAANTAWRQPSSPDQVVALRIERSDPVSGVGRTGL